jgi:hypothetical protein
MMKTGIQERPFLVSCLPYSVLSALREMTKAFRAWKQLNSNDENRNSGKAIPCFLPSLFSFICRAFRDFRNLQLPLIFPG